MIINLCTAKKPKKAIQDMSNFTQFYMSNFTYHNFMYICTVFKPTHHHDKRCFSG